jgi:lipopolysaccharide cholinephosphotransferase
MNDFSQMFPDNRLEGDTPLRQAQLVMLRILRIVDYICRKHHIRYWFCSGTLLGAVRHKGFIPWDDDLDIAMMREEYDKFIRIAKTELPDDLFLQTRDTEQAYDNLPSPCKIRDTKSLILMEHSLKKKYHQGIFIDIFPFDRYHKNGMKRRIERELKKTNRVICRCYDAEIGKQTSFYKRILAFFRPVFYYSILCYLKIVRPIIRKNGSLGDSRCLVGHGFDTPWIKYYELSDLFPLQESEFEGYMFFIPNKPDRYLKPIYGPDYMTPPPLEKRMQRHSTIIKPFING